MDWVLCILRNGVWWTEAGGGQTKTKREDTSHNQRVIQFCSGDVKYVSSFVYEVKQIVSDYIDLCVCVCVCVCVRVRAVRACACV